MAKVQGCELAMVANQLFRMAGAENNKDIEIEALKAELQEVRKYFTKCVELLESERGISYTKLKDEYSQHARYNTFKDIVQKEMGEARLEEFNALKRKARVDAQPDFEAFCKRLKQGFQESKATAKALQDEHEAKVKKIHDDAEKVKAMRKSRRGGKAGSAGADRKAPGGEAKAKEDKKPRPKTAPQIFNFEKETKEQYYAEKAASGKGKEFPTLVEWGNMKYKELWRERQEKYEAMALKARQELGLGPVVPRATPRAPAGASKKADNNQATLTKVIEKKSRQPKDKRVHPKKKIKDDNSDDDDSGDSEGEDSDDASNSKRKSASQTENAAPAYSKKMGMDVVTCAEQSRGQQPLVLLPSLCFGAPFSLQPDGKQVFITPAGKLVCPHGELSSTISYWLASEKKARLEGLPKPPRGGSRGQSSCDCQSTEGLNVTPDASMAPPPPPASLFQFLEDMGAELTTVKGREARRIPHVPGPMFVTTLGKLCCRHGASRASLSKRQKCSELSSRRPACQCVLKPLPARAGIKGLQLGKCAPCKAVLQVVRAQ